MPGAIHSAVQDLLAFELTSMAQLPRDNNLLRFGGHLGAPLSALCIV